MENKKINVRSTVDSTVGIDDPQLRFSRTWDRKGTVRQIEFDTLRELSYNVGVWNMLRTGILYIEDMEAKIALGLESEDAKEPTNVIVLTDAQKKRYMTVAPISELKAICAKLSRDELNNLADYCIENEIVDLDRCEYIKKLTGRDIYKTVQLNRQDKE